MSDVLAENMRFYADARFKQLTVWLAGMTLCAGGVAQFPADELVRGVSIRTSLALVAMLFTGAMWVLEVRAALYWVAHRETDPSVWPQRKVVWPWINSTNATLLMFIGAYSGWFWLGHEWGLSWPWLLITGAIGVLLGLFSVLNYRTLWLHKGGR